MTNNGCDDKFGRDEENGCDDKNRRKDKKRALIERSDPILSKVTLFLESLLAMQPSDPNTVEQYRSSLSHLESEGT